MERNDIKELKKEIKEEIKEEKIQSIEDISRYEKQAQILAFMKNPSKEDVADYLLGIKEGKWGNSIDYATMKLGIEYKVSF